MDRYPDLERITLTHALKFYADHPEYIWKVIPKILEIKESNYIERGELIRTYTYKRPAKIDFPKFFLDVLMEYKGEVPDIDTQIYICIKSLWSLHVNTKSVVNGIEIIANELLISRADALKRHFYS
jgi:hypothetical protein